MTKLKLMLLIFITPLFSFAGMEGMVAVPAGTYRPFVLKSNSKKGALQTFRSIPVKLASFYMDQKVVTNQDFSDFVKMHPEWSRSEVPVIFADEHYLSSWKSDISSGGTDRQKKPVTGVSWFAAKAYCESLGKTLPTTDQWEYALEDKGRNSPALKNQILEWYSKPNTRSLQDAGSDSANGYGLHDMAGVIWEWTLDFNAFMAEDELRDNSNTGSLFCGGGSLGKLSADDYATFMRFSFRSSLKAKDTTMNLGFRCAKEKS